MRERREIERAVYPDGLRADAIRSKIIIELLLDLRDQNAALLTVYEAQVGNERDAILKATGISGGSL